MLECLSYNLQEIDRFRNSHVTLDIKIHAGKHFGHSQNINVSRSLLITILDMLHFHAVIYLLLDVPHDMHFD